MRPTPLTKTEKPARYLEAGFAWLTVCNADLVHRIPDRILLPCHLQNRHGGKLPADHGQRAQAVGQLWQLNERAEPVFPSWPECEYGEGVRVSAGIPV